MSHAIFLALPRQFKDKVNGRKMSGHKVLHQYGTAVVNLVGFNDYESSTFRKNNRIRILHRKYTGKLRKKNNSYRKRNKINQSIKFMRY